MKDLRYKMRDYEERKSNVESYDFEKCKSGFWKIFNRSKRLEKKLILMALFHARSQNIEVSVILNNDKSPKVSKELTITFDGKNYDFSEIIDYSKKLNPSMYRKYREDSKRWSNIFNSIFTNFD